MTELFWRVLEYIRQGGWIMFPLGAVSVVMWLLVAERVQTFRMLSKGDMGVPDALKAIDGAPVDVTGYCLTAQLVQRFLTLRVGDVALDRHMLRQCAMQIRPHLTRHIAVISVLAAIAPLLGLLGTVIGMIETFNVISVFGTGNAKAMAGGISVALVTTQSGLLIAIPGLFASAALSRRAAKLDQSLEQLRLALDHHLKRVAGLTEDNR